MDKKSFMSVAYSWMLRCETQSILILVFLFNINNIISVGLNWSKVVLIK